LGVKVDARQVTDIKITKVVTEYQAQVLEDKNGICYTADFPEGDTKAIQYGVSVKAHATFFPHEKRGCDAMFDIFVMPSF